MVCWAFLALSGFALMVKIAYGRAYGGTVMKQPALVRFTTGLKTSFGRFMLANSITLTPGTITVKMDGDRLTVHCLKRSMLDTSPDSVFERWIRRLEA